MPELWHHHLSPGLTHHIMPQAYSRYSRETLVGHWRLVFFWGSDSVSLHSENLSLEFLKNGLPSER